MASLEALVQVWEEKTYTLCIVIGGLDFTQGVARSLNGAYLEILADATY